MSTRNPGARNRIESLYDQRTSLLHPLLPAVLDLHLHGRQPGLITPRIERLRLPEAISRWSFEERIHAARELCQLLEYTHRAGSLWGWLNPGKIFCDLNRIHCVNHVIPGEFQSRIDPSPASHRYCAPEILRDQQATVAGDLYTLGMTLYFIFTGSAPFYDSYPGQVDEKQKIAMPTLPGRMRPDLPGFVDTVIMNLVQKDPGDRIPLREVIGILESRARVSRHLVPVPSSSLVGRDGALLRCTEFLEEFRQQGKPILLVLTGSAGIGKTRLLDQIALRAKIVGLPVFQITHTPHDRALQPFRELVADLRSDQEASIERLAGKSEARDPAGFLLDGLVKLSVNRPVVLRLSNPHWAESASLELYRRLLLEGTSGVLVLSERRQDERTTQFQELESECDELGRLRTVNLGPLARPASRQLLENLFPGVLSERLIQRTIEKVSGNPRHLVELTRQLRRRGALRHGVRGWLPLMLNEDSWPPPSEIAEETRLRLGTLERSQVELLRTLAFLDRPVKLARFAGMPSHSRDNIQDTAWGLEKLGFVQISGGFRNPTIALASHWVGETIRRETPMAIRSKVHLEILQVLEREPDGEPLVVVEKAVHTLGTGLAQSDPELFATAIDHLASTGQFAASASILAEVEGETSSSGRDWKSARKHLDLLFRSGQFDRCEHRVRGLLGQPWPANQYAELLLLLGSLLLQRADLVGATSIFERLCDGTAPVTVDEMARASLLECHTRAGRLREARKLVATIFQTPSRRHSSGSRRQRNRGESTSSETSQPGSDRTGRTRRWRRGGPEMRPGLDVPTEIARALAELFSRLGLHEESLSWRGRTIRALYRQGLNGFLSPELLELAQDRLLSGRPRAAERLAREALRVAEEAASPEQLARVTLFQAQHLRLLGRHWDSERLLHTIQGGSFAKVPLGLRSQAARELALNECDRLLPEAALRTLGTGHPTREHASDLF